MQYENYLYVHRSIIASELLQIWRAMETILMCIVHDLLKNILTTNQEEFAPL